MRPLNASVPIVVRSLLARAPMSEGKFAFAWAAAVGPAVHRVTRASLREDGTVDVEVHDPVWKKELKRSQAEILGKLQGLLGGSVVRKLKVTGGR